MEVVRDGGVPKTPVILTRIKRWYGDDYFQTRLNVHIIIFVSILASALECHLLSRYISVMCLGVCATMGGNIVVPNGNFI